jgi:hypothetical protein
MVNLNLLCCIDVDVGRHLDLIEVEALEPNDTLFLSVVRLCLTIVIRLILNGSFFRADKFYQQKHKIKTKSNNTVSP